jgi:hypothetical protein
LARLIDIDRLAAILSEAAEAEIMPHFRRLDAADVRMKTSAIDLVTEADEATERFINAECAKLWPEALVIRRMTQSLRTFPLRPHHRVLDVGGYADFWRNARANAKITVLNLDAQQESSESLQISTVVGDGTRLEYADKSFDLVFSNSVIEHLGTFERQQRFASEAMRSERDCGFKHPPGLFRNFFS